jgi:hypothetical protein
MSGWKNGDLLGGRARRGCPNCGGTLYDWGCGWSAFSNCYVLEWKCHGGCDVGLGERLSSDELRSVRAGDQRAVDDAAARLEGRPRWIAWWFPHAGNSLKSAWR